MFYLSEPKPNLNLENDAQVNPNQTWTAKIFWAWAKPEPEPLFETVRHPAFHTVRTLAHFYSQSSMFTMLIFFLFSASTLYL